MWNVIYEYVVKTQSNQPRIVCVNRTDREGRVRGAAHSRSLGSWCPPVGVCRCVRCRGRSLVWVRVLGYFSYGVRHIGLGHIIPSNHPKSIELIHPHATQSRCPQCTQDAQQHASASRLGDSARGRLLRPTYPIVGGSERPCAASPNLKTKRPKPDSATRSRSHRPNCSVWRPDRSDVRSGTIDFRRGGL